MRRVILGLGTGLFMLISWIVRLILGMFGLLLELAKVIILLFGLVARVFLAFVRVGIP